MVNLLKTHLYKACYHNAVFNHIFKCMNNSHPLYPVQMTTCWQSPSSFNINNELRDWLLNPASLTARLKQHCSIFRVEVLGQHIELCSAAEANTDIPQGEEVLVREVVLWCDEKPQVFARSLLPISSLTGEQQQLAHLGTQSLGQVLFNHADLQRKCIEISSFDCTSSVAKLCANYNLPITATLYGRRSVFIIENKPVMVAEVFLPEAIAYTNHGQQQ